MYQGPIETKNKYYVEKCQSLFQGKSSEMKTGQFILVDVNSPPVDLL